MNEGESSAGRKAPRRPLEVGTLGRPHGLRGELTVRLFHPASEIWKPRSRLFVADAREDGSWSEGAGWFVMEQVAAAAKPPRVRFREVSDREKARRLSGKGLWVDRSSLPPPGPGEAYLADLIGLEVVDSLGTVVGRVGSVTEAGMHEFLVVEGGFAGPQWIPTTAGILAKVDAGAGRLHLAVAFGPDGRLAAEETE